MIDLSGLNTVTVDPAARRARAGGGATLGELDAATQEHGLAVAGGHGQPHRGRRADPRRRHGLAEPAARADHRQPGVGRGGDRRRQILRPAETEHPDLFWALRGGGGNFGVVTEFEFRLHEVGPMIQLGMLFVEQDRAADASRTGRDATLSPPEGSRGIACMNAPPAPFVPEQ